ncbi:MAG: hypothetical protein QXY70_00600 [Nanopusillaceae archaeon]
MYLFKKNIKAFESLPPEIPTPILSPASIKLYFSIVFNTLFS